MFLYMYCHDYSPPYTASLIHVGHKPMAAMSTLAKAIKDSKSLKTYTLERPRNKDSSFFMMMRLEVVWHFF